MTRALLDLIWEHDELAELDPAERRLAIRNLVAEATPAADVGALVTRIADTVDGYGPLTELFSDQKVTDVLVNGAGEVWVERAGRLLRVPHAFMDVSDLRRFVGRALADGGARADASRPIADARLADGSRIHVVLPPVAPKGPLVSIRRFPEAPLALEDLVASGMLTAGDAAALRELVARRAGLAITGGTGSGKTTLLNALLSTIPDDERIVLIEETPELRPTCSHHVSLVARPPNIEGSGGIDLSTLVKAALRMRPDRIVVGEMRGAEAVAVLGAMSVGHEGSMVTLHARSPDDAIERIVTLALQAATGATEASLRAQAHAAFDAVVHLERAGGRRVLRALHVL